VCRRKRRSRMGLQEDRREDQDSEIREIEETLRNHVWLETRQVGKYIPRSFHAKDYRSISEKFEKAKGKQAKVYATPGAPGKTLRKNEGTMVDIDSYRSIAGKSCPMLPR
jgi:hypothetical protein